MKKKVLITGGAGFIAHHTILYLLKNTDWDIVSLDRLDYSGNLNRISDMMNNFDAKEKSTYVGQWKNHKRWGKGTLTTSESSITGIFKDLTVEGKGTMKLGGMFTYEGEFKNTEPHGKGVMT